MRKKIDSYLGFAKKSGNLVSGTNTCAFAIGRGKARLVILAEDISENSEKKMMKEIRKHGVRYVKYGKGEELSRIVGESGRSVFAVCDDNFAKVIMDEIEGRSE